MLLQENHEPLRTQCALAASKLLKNLIKQEGLRLAPISSGRQMLKIQKLKRDEKRVTVPVLKQLLLKVKEDMHNMENNEETHQIKRHWSNTLTYLKSKKKDFISNDPEFADILI
ncbi:hypothetical protein Avbf_12887 [Armadillidium vulgare]|nr:hypothetical protein Avbf_12887 [Armadillidium vulgare]